MRNLFPRLSFAVLAGLGVRLVADPALLDTSCAKCHNDDKLKGDFSLSMLEAGPTHDNIFLWEDSLDYVRSGEMPPPDESELNDSERTRLVEFLTREVRRHHEATVMPSRVTPRRLNNRELMNSVRDVLLIEDVGSHDPMANLLGDTLEDGFDTNGDALGMSQYHLEQYIDALRAVLDAIILTGERPTSRKVVVQPENLGMTSLSQTARQERANRTAESLDFEDPRLRMFFDNFETVPSTGRYRLKIRAMGKDRGVYETKDTGIYAGDPIRLRVHLGSRIRDFDLPDEQILEIELDEWLAAGTRIGLSYPTDGLRLRGNGNFKFQYAIAGEHLRRHDPVLYDKVVTQEVPRAKFRSDAPNHWVHWVPYWQGPRPRVFGAEIEGPLFQDWPSARQVALLGPSPDVAHAAAILQPIAERAWRRDVKAHEISGIVKLVQAQAERLGPVEALKEGIVAILVSPSFLLINAEDTDARQRFATKLSYFLGSTTPDDALLQAARNGHLEDFEAVRAEVEYRLRSGAGTEFLEHFPYAWLQLDRISFMAPDPEHFPLFERKHLSEDMVAEVLAFFRHMVENNLSVPEFLTADYSFINADLAKVYGVTEVPADSRLRRYTFTDGRRGGLLGMGAFLTLTADSLGTSPIHRAVYVMENFMGIHPSPPPANLKIEEPDVRQARTIKEILAAHTENESCASCHQSIDPYGFAFENFDPVGAWRDFYTLQIAPKPTKKELQEIDHQDRLRRVDGLPPLPRPWENEPIAIDASNRFRDGTEYHDIVEYRRQLATDTYRERFVRCLVAKLLTYANGTEPQNNWEVAKILKKSAQHDYRLIETIAAVVDSPLFRENEPPAAVTAAVGP